MKQNKCQNCPTPIDRFFNFVNNNLEKSKNY